MAIFNSYFKLPEGTVVSHTARYMEHWIPPHPAMAWPYVGTHHWSMFFMWNVTTQFWRFIEKPGSICNGMPCLQTHWNWVCIFLVNSKQPHNYGKWPCIFHGKTRYFDWAIFNRYVTNYQGVFGFQSSFLFPFLHPQAQSPVQPGSEQFPRPTFWGGPSVLNRWQKSLRTQNHKLLWYFFGNQRVQSSMVQNQVLLRLGTGTENRYGGVAKAVLKTRDPLVFMKKYVVPSGND